MRDQVVHDAHASLGDDRQLEIQQVVVILVYRPGQRVFDRHDGVVDVAGRQRAENLFEPFTRLVIEAIAQQQPAGLLAEGAARRLETPLVFAT
jgi:hypothetical protein